MPSAFYSRIAFVLPNIHSRIEDLIALEASSSEESEAGVIKVKPRPVPIADALPIAPGLNPDEALLLNDPPVSLLFLCISTNNFFLLVRRLLQIGP